MILYFCCMFQFSSVCLCYVYTCMCTCTFVFIYLCMCTFTNTHTHTSVCSLICIGASAPMYFIFLFNSFVCFLYLEADHLHVSLKWLCYLPLECQGGKSTLLINRFKQLSLLCSWASFLATANC